MKQINNGFADYYYLQEDGRLYNAEINKYVNFNKDYIYVLKTIDNQKKRISLKRLYKLTYNKTYCIDDIENQQNEEWKEIQDTEGLYYISSNGRVKSLQGIKARILKTFKNKSGYDRVDIRVNGRRQTKLVSRLVAAAFLPMPQKLDMQLHHISGLRDCNKASNLQWLTPAEHAKKHKKKKEYEKNVETAKST